MTTKKNRNMLPEFIMARCFKLTDELHPNMANLRMRWLKRHKHKDEGIDDYKNVFVQQLATIDPGVKITKMNKQPFGFNFEFGDGDVYQIFMTNKSYGWKML